MKKSGSTLKIVVIAVVVSFAVFALMNYPTGETVTVKAWIDQTGTQGFQTIPMAAVAPDPNYNWIEAPLHVPAGIHIRLTASPTLNGAHWAFWQEENQPQTIVYSRTITINSTSTWWENYYA